MERSIGHDTVDTHGAGIQTILGDCNSVLGTDEPAEYFDLILTDPPYGLSGRQAEAEIALTEKNGKAREPFKRHFGEWDKQWDPTRLVDWAARLLRPGGSLIAFMAHEWIGAYLDVALGWRDVEFLDLQIPGMPENHRASIPSDDGFQIRARPRPEDLKLETRALGVWVKTNPPCRARPGYQHNVEFWAWMVKPGKAPTWNGGYTCPKSIITANALSCEGGKLFHPTQKPLKLIRGFIQRHSNPGDLVLDPYMGSGTTLVAAKSLGRRAVGIEIDPGYYGVARDRLAQDGLPLEHHAHQEPAPEQTGLDLTEGP